MAHVAESTHWYRRNGDPAYTVRGKNGKDRPTTLRDARQLDLLPSVTSVIKAGATPGLERWKQEQLLLAALTLPRLEHETEASWIARVWEDARAQATKAAERGTALHAELQGYFEGGEPRDWYQNVLAGAREVEAAGNGWVPEKSFSNILGFGGKVDLHNKHCVIDCKTKEFDASGADKLTTWDEHACQLAAYRYGLGMETAQCGILYVSVTEPIAKLIWLNESEVLRGWEMFKGLLAYWRAKHRYYP